jgi:DNA-binding MarR family transcriptional regulator
MVKPVVAPSKREKELQDLLRLRGVEDTRGFALMRALMASARMLEVVADHDLQEAGLSLPRLRLLVWLHLEEQRGNQEGISPSVLSHHQSISKNTVSSLLASLEERGLIERALSSEDKRSFKIQLTRAGRTLVQSTLPKHNSALQQVFVALSAEEQKSLLKLLSKLRESLHKQITDSELDSYKTSPE